jgi:hypothetical protein
MGGLRRSTPFCERRARFEVAAKHRKTFEHEKEMWNALTIFTIFPSMLFSSSVLQTESSEGVKQQAALMKRGIVSAKQ